MEKKRMDYIPMWGRYLTMFRNAGLNDVQLGHLMRAMMEYHFEAKEPMDLEDKLEVFWMFIREDLDRAKLKYDQAVENGRKGGRPKKTQAKPKESSSNRKKGRTTLDYSQKQTSYHQHQQQKQKQHHPTPPGAMISLWIKKPTENSVGFSWGMRRIRSWHPPWALRNCSGALPILTVLRRPPATAMNGRTGHWSFSGAMKAAGMKLPTDRTRFQRVLPGISAQRNWKPSSGSWGRKVIRFSRSKADRCPHSCP